jgi:hypothetical protein
MNQNRSNFGMITERDYLDKTLEEANNDAMNVEQLRAPMTNILGEIVAFCSVCINDAKNDESGTWVSADRITHLRTWSEQKAQEIIDLSLVKKGEVIAYKKALEALTKRDPGQSNS